jgi:hypothetical protein
MHAADHLPIAPEVLGRLRAWEGRVETRHDEVTRAPLRALAATLDLEGLEPALGAPVPALWHWLYFLPRSPQSEIGADGHPKLGGFLPPVPLPRRMWAGGRLTWHSPVRVGDCLQRTSSIVSVKHKAGRTGDLIFVVVRHEIATADKLLLTEEQDLVYRAPQQAGEPSAPAQAAPADATFWRDLTPDPVLLFRYSALTFNSHPRSPPPTPPGNARGAARPVRPLRLGVLAEGRFRARLSRGVRRCADRSRLDGGADPAGVRRLRPGPGRSFGDHGRDQLLGRQRRRSARPDVQHGHACCATARRSRSSRYLPDASPPASCGCRRWPSPSRPPAPTPRS